MRLARHALYQTPIFFFTFNPAGMGKIFLLAGFMQLDGPWFCHPISATPQIRRRCGEWQMTESQRPPAHSPLIFAENPVKASKCNKPPRKPALIHRTLPPLLAMATFKHSNFEFVDENQTPVATFCPPTVILP
jgi:hypothetical protein